MTGQAKGGSGDQARVSILVKVPPAEAFRVFTEEIDQWWRRGLRYRVWGRNRGILRIEPFVGGRLFESIETSSGTKVFQSGTVTRWEPPARLSFDWRGANFAPGEVTHVDVRFEPSPSGTRVELVHGGWREIRPDHPARHGLETVAFVRMLGMWWGDLLSSLRVHVGRRRGPSGVSTEDTNE